MEEKLVRPISSFSNPWILQILGHLTKLAYEILHNFQDLQIQAPSFGKYMHPYIPKSACGHFRYDIYFGTHKAEIQLLLYAIMFIIII